MEIGEAGESCALAIATRLGMPEQMIERARRYAYGAWEESDQNNGDIEWEKVKKAPKAKKGEGISSAQHKDELLTKFTIGDSVYVLPDKKKGIVCRPVNDQGVLQVQLPDKKIWINHKRIKLLVPAAELYPEDYDFSIIFDTVENRKARHKMEKGYQEGLEIRTE